MQFSEYVLVFDALAAGLHGPAICASLQISRATFNRVLSEFRTAGCSFEYDPITKTYNVLDAGPFARPADLLTVLSVQPNPDSPVIPESVQGLPRLPGANAADGRAAQTVRRGVGSEDGGSEGA